MKVKLLVLAHGEDDEGPKKTRLEVLNANNTSKVLNSVVEDLNKKDFEVIKIGNYPTTRSEKSRIIDYGIGTDEELSALKEALKITTVEKAEDNNSKVKYTVIIGESYK